MRIRRVWPAVSLVVIVFLAACGSRTRETNSASTQTQTNTSRGSTGIVKAAYTTKDDGKGAPGEKTDTFGPDDGTIHCVVELAEPRPGARITYSWWIVEAEGARNEKINDFDYTVRPEDRIVHGHLSMPEDWPPGRYKVEVYVNGNLEGVVEYRVT